MFYNCSLSVDTNKQFAGIGIMVRKKHEIDESYWRIDSNISLVEQKSMAGGLLNKNTRC